MFILIALILFIVPLLLSMQVNGQATSSGDVQSGWGVNIINGTAVADSTVLMGAQRAADSITAIKASIALKIGLTALSLTATGVSGAATYNNSTGVFNIPIYATSAPTVDTISSARTFNTVYLMSSTKYVDVRVSAEITCALSLSGGQDGMITLQISPDASTWTTASRLRGSNTGTLTIGLATTQITGGQLSAIVPPNYYWKVITTNNTGTPTYTMQQGNKITY